MNYNNHTQPPYNNSPPGNYCWFCGEHIYSQSLRAGFNYSNKKQFYWLYPPGSLKPLGMVHRDCDINLGDEPQKVFN